MLQYIFCFLETLCVRPSVGRFLGNLFFNWVVRSTVCLRSSDPFYVVTDYIKWVTTSWTFGIIHSSTCPSVGLGPVAIRPLHTSEKS